MSAPEVTTRSGSPEETGADTRVVGLFDGDQPEDVRLRALVDSGEAKPALKRAALTHEDGGRRVILAGLGKREEFGPEQARVAASAAAARAKEAGASSLSWAAPEGEGVVGALVEGTLLKLYSYDEFKSSKDENGEPARIGSLEVVSDSGDAAEEAERARVVAEAQNRARDLQNAPGNLATPTWLAERAEEVAARHGSLSFEALGRDEIAERGMGAFAAVAQGSAEEPRLIVLRHEPSGGADGGGHLGFVGKGVTFDTGGISIKPASKMHEMKFDMSGAAAVISAMDAIAALEVPVRITAVCPATENMPSGRSVKPGDIVRARNGKTIEVNNTDAEGRLILSDALCYAIEQGAERIVDLATLTGAIVTTLGHTHAGLFSNDDEWCGQVEAACDATGEIAWRLPLHPEYFDLTKGKVGDLVNSAEQRAAMSIYAAEFLRQFVDERPWVHIDIAGVAWDMKREYVKGGASGWGVRSLVELARRAAGSV